MGFWKNLLTGLKITGGIALEAAAETAASGKPITLGNTGKQAAKVIIERKESDNAKR